VKRKRPAHAAAQSPEDKLPIAEHLKGLRRTIIGCLIASAVCMGVCYGYFRAPLMGLIVNPLEGIGAHIVYTAVTESFTVEMKACLIAGIIAASPVISFLVWRFVSPAFFPGEKRRAALYTTAAAVLFCGGVAFCYIVLLPFTLQFFAGAAAIDIDAMLTISNYLDFFSKMIFAFGLIFETPLVTYFLVRVHVVTAKTLRKARKYVLLGVFVLAAIITPPDVVSQLYVGIPMYLMYEAGMLIAWISEKREAKKLKQGRVEALPVHG
jgi:sec-independent protein translocase protein TatC